MPDGSNFATEVKTAHRRSNAERAATAAPVTLPTTSATTQSGTSSITAPAADASTAALVEPADMFKLPSGDAPVVPEAKDKPATVAATAAPEVKPTETTPLSTTETKPVAIRIGARTFTDPNEAIAYANELELNKEADAAYVQGVKDATKKPETTAEKTPAEVFAEEVFVDPVAATKKLTESLKQDIRQEYSQTRQKEFEQQMKAQAEANAWAGFFKENTDLSEPETQAMVKDYLVKKHWDEISVLPPKEGFAKLADYSRKALRISQQAALPTTTMPAGPATTTPSGDNAPAVPTAAPQQEKVDFVTQVNNMRRRKK